MAIRVPNAKFRDEPRPLPRNFRSFFPAHLCRIQPPIAVAVQPAKGSRGIREFHDGQGAIPIRIQGRHQLPRTAAGLEAVDDNMPRRLGWELWKQKLSIGTANRKAASKQEESPYYHTQILSQSAVRPRIYLALVPHDSVENLFHGADEILQQIVVALEVGLDFAEEIVDLGH